MVAMSFSASADAQGSAVLVFNNVVGNEPMVLDGRSYTNSLGQEFTVTMLRYYIGNIRWYTNTGDSICNTGYYLLDQDDTATLRISVPTPENVGITAVSFLVGVDSADNCSGAQSGALDPIHGMFWAWNTGYIFLKMEGRAAASSQTGHIFEFHIGGYREPNNAIRRVRLAFGKPVNKLAQVKIRADIGVMLSQPAKIDSRQLSSVTDFHHATLVADNYSNMFTISEP